MNAESAGDDVISLSVGGYLGVGAVVDGTEVEESVDVRLEFAGVVGLDVDIALDAGGAHRGVFSGAGRAGRGAGHAGAVGLEEGVGHAGGADRRVD